MKAIQNGVRMIYNGQDLPEKRGEVVVVNRRISKGLYGITFLDGYAHECVRRFLSIPHK